MINVGLYLHEGAGDVSALAASPSDTRVFSAGCDGQVILYKLGMMFACGIIHPDCFFIHVKLDHSAKTNLNVEQIFLSNGNLTTESLKFFSPIVILTKISPRHKNQDILFSLFKDYCKAWLSLINQEKDEADVSQTEN
nr:heme oxygenase 2 protein 1 [Tanacetum cinerariifolium]